MFTEILILEPARGFSAASTAIASLLESLADALVAAASGPRQNRSAVAGGFRVGAVHLLRQYSTGARHAVPLRAAETEHRPSSPIRAIRAIPGPLSACLLFPSDVARSPSAAGDGYDLTPHPTECHDAPGRHRLLREPGSSRPRTLSGETHRSHAQSPLNT